MNLQQGDLVLAVISDIEFYGKVIFDTEHAALCIKCKDYNISVSVCAVDSVHKLTGIDICKLGYKFISTF